MTKSSFQVVSDAEKWRFWTNPHIWARVSSNFDDLDHPYGQWTIRLTRVGEYQSTGPCLLALEFLVDEAPWREIQPGMVLACFGGVTKVTDLIVQPESPV